MPENTLIVLTTLPDEETAVAIAERLVEQNLAACVNISGEITSVYRWNGQIQNDKECQLAIKTTRERYPALQTWLTRQHPYNIPEILALPIAEGLPDYLKWVETCTEKS